MSVHEHGHVFLRHMRNKKTFGRKERIKKGNKKQRWKTSKSGFVGVRCRADILLVKCIHEKENVSFESADERIIQEKEEGNKEGIVSGKRNG